MKKMATDFVFEGILIAALLCVKETYSQTVTLTSEQTMPVTEGDRLRFTCLITGNPSIVQYALSSETSSVVYWLTRDGKCDQIQLANKTVYSASCDRFNSKWYLDIRLITMSFHQKTMICEAQYDTGDSPKVGDNVHITVKKMLNPTGSSSISDIIQNDCPVIGRNILIVVVVLLLCLQLAECVVFVWLFRKGNIFLSRKTRAYEDFQTNKTEGQTYNDMNTKGGECNPEQIYDDVY